jgi:SAM-dependent methyltransferase/dienelactone hydrolase
VVSLLVPGQALDVVLHHRYVGYLFETTVIEAGEAVIRCSHPSTVYQSEKRSKLRHRLAETTPAVVEIESPRRDGSVHQLPVIDVSATGASFEVDLDRTLLYVGTPLEPFRVRMGDLAVLEERAEVRHVTAVPGRGMAKVGVRFARRAPRTRTVKVDVAAAGTFSAPSPATHARRLKFPNAFDEEVVALFNLSGRGDERFSGPVVIIPPAWRYTKESFAAYALSLVGSFERQGLPAAVLRLDFSHHRGESFVPPRNREGGRESVDFTLSHALEDILASVRFAHANPLFEPTETILFGCSFSAPLALAAAAREPRISHVVCPMGTPSTQELVTSASGGLDYLGGYARGARFGEVDFLGQLIDMDRAAADALNHGLALFDDMAETVAGVRAPISWIVGHDDGWVDPERVAELGRTAAGPFEVTAVRAGHLPTHDDAAPVAAVVTGEVFRRLGLAPDRVVTPAVTLLRDVDRAEWVTAPKVGVDSPDEWWRGYLLGGGQDSLGFDVLGMTDAYGDFVVAQGELLDLESVHTVLDAGAGTGQFWRRWLARPDAPRPQRVELVDLVKDALARATTRIAELGAVTDGMELDTRVVDLQLSRLLPVARFVAGEYHGIGCLDGRVEGLDGSVLSRLVEHYREPGAAAVHAAVRGQRSALAGLEYLDEDVLAAVADLGRAARMLDGTLAEEDLAPAGRVEGARLLAGGRAHEVHTGLVDFQRLQFGRALRPRPLPLADGAYDRILASLLVPYLMNPDETLMELRRALRPGGVLVVSTMRPDTDMSRIQGELVSQVQEGRVQPPEGWTGERLLDELRAYSSAAAFLLRLTEEGTFRFLAQDQLAELMEGAGLVDVRIQACFGDPPQAYVAAGRKPTEPATSP